MKGSVGRSILVVTCVFVLMFVPNYAQYQLSPIAYRIIPEFGMSAVQFSALFSAAMVTGIFVSPVAGMLCDKFGTKRMIGIAALITMVALFARVFVHDYAAFFVCMLLAGITATFVNSNTSKIMGSWFSESNIGIAVGVGTSGSMLAMFVGMGTSTLFASTRALFAVSAALGVLGALLWWTCFKESPAVMAQDENGKSANAADARVAGGSAEAAPPLAECLKVAVRSRNIWIVGLALAMNMAATMCVMTFMPQALVAVRGFDEVTAGGVTAIVTAGCFAGGILVPVIAARFRDFRPVIAALSVFAGVGVAFAWLAPEGIALTVGLFFAGFCTSGVMPVLMSVPVRLPEIGPVYAGTAGGVAASIQLIGAVVVPTYILTPLLGDNFVAFYCVAGALCLVMAACCMLIPKLGK